MSDPSQIADSLIALIQRTEAEFMTVLGISITQWARVEDQLFKLCRDILGTTTDHTAIVYYRTPSLEGRISLADELIDTIFPPPESGKHRHDDYKCWELIKAAMKAEMPIRNRLAHSPVSLEIDTEGRKPLSLESQQHPHEAARGKGVKPPITISDIKDHLGRVRPLALQLGEFRNQRLRGHIATRYPQNISILTGQD